MLKKIRAKLLVVLAAAVLVAVPIAATGTARAADEPSNKGNVDLQNNLGCGATFNVTPSADCGKNTETGAGKVQGVITTILNYFSIIVGLIAVVMLIFGGLKYITSGGDTGKATSARSTIVSAVIGLVIVALAQIIVQFVLDKTTKGANGDSSTTTTTP